MNKTFNSPKHAISVLKREVPVREESPNVYLVPMRRWGNETPEAFLHSRSYINIPFVVIRGEERLYIIDLLKKA